MCPPATVKIQFCDSAETAQLLSAMKQNHFEEAPLPVLPFLKQFLILYQKKKKKRQ